MPDSNEPKHAKIIDVGELQTELNSLLEEFRHLDIPSEELTEPIRRLFMNAQHALTAAISLQAVAERFHEMWRDEKADPEPHGDDPEPRARLH